MSTKRKKVYWLADHMTGDHRMKAVALGSFGYDVFFFTTTDAFVTEMQKERAGILVVSSHGDYDIIERSLMTILAMPETTGARLILALGPYNEDRKHDDVARLQFLAAAGGFRDFIPLDTDIDTWVTRFRYATAGTAVRVNPPTGQVTTNELVGVHFPARITWIADEEIRIESRIMPPRGAKIQLTGPFAEALGESYVTIDVKETAKDHLTYRFSDAITGKWSTPRMDIEKRERLFRLLENNQTGPRARIFVAARDSALRNEILSQFEDPRFEVSSALQKNSIVNEPKFFSPDLVMIEHTLCIKEERERFEQMLDNLSDQTHVVVIGHDREIDEIKRRFPLKKITRLGRMPRNFEQSIIRRYVPASVRRLDTPEYAIHLPPDSIFSLAEAGMSGRLKQLHPKQVQLALPHKVGNFALARLDAPFIRKRLGRNVYLKIQRTFQNAHPSADSFLHHVGGSLTDLSKSERIAMTNATLEMIRRYIGPLAS